MIHIPIMRLRVTFSLPSGGVLPKYKGSMVRGVFGHALKQISCRRFPPCQSCKQPELCPYGVMFETPEVRKERFGRGSAAPNAHLFRSGDLRTTYRPHDSFAFELQYIGYDAKELYPVVLQALKTMGEFGLTANRFPTRLESIHEWNFEEGVWECLYKRGTSLGNPMVYELRPQPIGGATGAKIEFVSPLRIQEDGKLLTTLSFPQFFRALMRRIRLIQTVVLGKDSEGERSETQLLEVSKEIQTVSSSFRWNDIGRYSNRHERKVPLGGMIGTLSIQGDSSALRVISPYIQLGEQIHIGKNTTFGLGQYSTIWHL